MRAERRCCGYGGTLIIDPASQTTGVAHFFSGPTTLNNTTLGNPTLTIESGFLTNVNTAFGLTLTNVTTLGNNTIFQENANGTAIGTITISGLLNIATATNITTIGPGNLTLSAVITLNAATTLTNNGGVLSVSNLVNANGNSIILAG